MYHGTDAAAAAQIQRHGFRVSSDGMLGRGVYLTRDFTKTLVYARKKCGRGVVLEVRVRVGRVKRIDRVGHPLQKTWQSRGFDTAWVPGSRPGRPGMVPSGKTENCVKDPKRIRVVGAKHV